jgi:CRISPR-associated protein (TIGR02584 family)
MPARKILLCATGLSPQIVTETVYALATGDTPWLPDEIHLVTTAEGARRAHLTLLSDAPGWFARLRTEYALPPMRFDADTIHIATNAAGSPLDDIRSGDDNEAAADFIAECIRALTADPDVELHVSLAGGRKTMGFYAGYALSLYGRAQDRLSHVLVSAPFETHREFYYPTRASQTLYLTDNRPIDSRDAAVTLAEIPFVRLRDGLPEALLAGRARFSETVAEAQRAIAAPTLALHPAQREIVADGQRLKLEPNVFTYYWLLATRAQNGLTGLHWSEPECSRAMLACYARLVGEFSGDYARKEASYQRFEPGTVEPLKSKLNKILVSALGKARARPYLLQLQDTLPGTRYRRVGLDLPSSAIQIDTPR